MKVEAYKNTGNIGRAGNFRRITNVVRKIKSLISSVKSKVYDVLPNELIISRYEKNVIKNRDIQKEERISLNRKIVDEDFEVKHPTHPVRLNIETTNICNSNCIFCNYQFQKRKQGTMSMELFEKIVTQANDIGVKRLTICPIVGEPLLDKHLKDRLKLVKKYPSQHVDLTTNGILLGKKEIHKHLCNGSLTKLNISLTEFDENIYEKMYRNKFYKQMVEGISTLLKYHKKTNSKLKIIINFRPLTKDLKMVFKSEDYKKYIRPYVDGKNVKICINPAFDNRVGLIKQEGILEEVEFYSNLSNKKGKKIKPCIKLYYGIISYDGYYLACACGLDSKGNRNNELTLGHLDTETIHNMYNGRKLKGLRESFTKGICPDICSTCTVYR